MVKTLEPRIATVSDGVETLLMLVASGGRRHRDLSPSLLIQAIGDMIAGLQRDARRGSRPPPPCPAPPETGNGVGEHFS